VVTSSLHESFTAVNSFRLSTVIPSAVRTSSCAECWDVGKPVAAGTAPRIDLSAVRRD